MKAGVLASNPQKDINDMAEAAAGEMLEVPSGLAKMSWDTPAVVPKIELKTGENTKTLYLPLTPEPGCK